MWAMMAKMKYPSTPTDTVVVTEALPMAAPAIRPAAASALIPISAHHQSLGKLTPLRHRLMNFGGLIDMSASPARTAANR